MEVRCAVYDLSRGMAAQMSQAILGSRIEGIWHTGIVVYGIEYYFGGGVQMIPEGAFSRQNGIQVGSNSIVSFNFQSALALA
jgi:hypothetical protein